MIDNMSAFFSTPCPLKFWDMYIYIGFYTIFAFVVDLANISTYLHLALFTLSSICEHFLQSLLVLLVYLPPLNSKLHDKQL